MTTATSAATESLVRLAKLSVRFPGRGHSVDAVTDVSLELPCGQVLALVGESGSGKSVTASTIAGLLPRSAAPQVDGSVRFNDTELVGLAEKDFRALRGSRIGTIFQNPATSFDPSFTIGSQLVELIRLHHNVSRVDAVALAREWLVRVGITDTTRVLASYPHQLSGGMKQRVMITVACIPEPELLIADEPTTALDPTISAQILDLIDNLRRELGMTVLLVTHDFGVVARLSDSVAVLRDGRLVEHGRTEQVLAAPTDAYTRRLIAAVPELRTDAIATDRREADPTVVAVSQVTKRFAPGSNGTHDEFTALHDITLDLRRGRTLGLIGESGSGKSTLARIIAGIDAASSGSVTVRTDRGDIDVEDLGRVERADNVQLVFQDHGSALNPRLRIIEQVARPLRRAGLSKVAARERALQLLDQVGLDRDLGARYPHQLSGGQRQRIGIARALGLAPSVILLDEPTSALDVTTQAEILDLLAALREQTQVTFVVIAHDLAVVQAFADDVVVLDRGRIVDRFASSEFHAPQRHSVTKRLVDAVLPVRAATTARNR